MSRAYTIKFTYALILLLITTNAISQKGGIEGFISDADYKTPLSGASVIISGNKGDNTDAFGKFSIQGVNPGRYELVVSYISYKTEIIPVEVKENIVSRLSIALKKTNLDLSEVRVNGKRNNALNTIGSIDIMLRPINTSQDVLRIIPGLFIAQHAGGGKAEQIFLRGFDIDHGTDINISVDGIPVNMVSHAHGQGYADLHFLIPETVEKVNFDKGPYFANKGNLATAGYAEFHTKEFIDKNSLKLELGQFNTQRAVTQLKLFNHVSDKKKEQVYLASELFTSDGFFDSPQDFHRFNLMGKYNAWFGNQTQLTITASTFNSKWSASGQIPERAVEAGLITRFGSIDSSEGGNTRRNNITIRFAKQWKNNWQTTDQFYFTNYHFNLFSNFTFFLKDSLNGDEIQQKESRNILGYHTTASRSWSKGNYSTRTELGGGFRFDNIRNLELSHVIKRQFLNPVQKGDVKEMNSYLYWHQQLDLSKSVSITGGLRFDIFQFAYKNLLQSETSFEKQQRSILSPKLNFIYSASSKVKIYLNNGIGFHSNDARVILNNTAENILPKVFGTDLGIILKPAKNLILKTALWHLYAEQEFIYVGDEGIIEPGGKSRRMGIDLSARYQFTNWLFGDVDFNYTKARTIDEAKGKNYIPLAPAFTSIGGIAAKLKNGMSGSIRYRLMGNRPANETNTIQAYGYFITDILVSYKIKKIELTISIENLFDEVWKEAQFDTESKLKFESSPASEIHFTPGTPRFIKGGIIFKF